MWLLYKITDDLVVEVVNVDPLDPLFHVLLLFLFQDQLNKQLLQLFVTVVDAELLKTETHTQNIRKIVSILPTELLHICMSCLLAICYFLYFITLQQHDSERILKVICRD